MSSRVTTEKGFIHFSYVEPDHYIVVVCDGDSHVKLELNQQQYGMLSISARHELIKSFGLTEQMELPLD